VRWKLLIITSLVVALINAGVMRALAYWMAQSMRPRGVSTVAVSGIIMIPLIFIMIASVFVYRHTARRRKLQAALTALFALALTVATIFASRMFIDF
jgi:hypothetical protein